ncbi:hypothetical protein AB6813_19785 [bacterium RCC_150]
MLTTKPVAALSRTARMAALTAQMLPSRPETATTAPSSARSRNL